MNIAARLEELRYPFPGCRTLVLADLAAGLVLGTNSGNTRPQEQLDRLAQSAGRLLNVTFPSTALLSSTIHTVIVIEGDVLQTFITNPADGEVAICCTGSRTIDTAALATRARALLAELGGAE
ncbi:MAG: hypothetical protein NTX73_08395 [Rhodobacterales bacterium]|jgi:hypothetical protein|nr:hypothetical protein [Rhodobacterales bacterium]